MLRRREGAKGGRRQERRHKTMYFRVVRGSRVIAALLVFFLAIQYVLFVGITTSGRHFRPGESGALAYSEPPDVEIGDDTKRLGVVVPVLSVDLDKALNSLACWPGPVVCSPLTLRRMDLILYYAGGAEEDKVSERLISGLAETGSRCFARTRLVMGNLTFEEDVYPKGPSVQFYNMFLDKRIRMQLSEYEVLALIEWDVIVAHESSFHELYQVAFGGVEPFWVKGSTLEGVNFHETVLFSEDRFIVGHINGNALYNNSDPAFVEFIEYTLKRWDYSHSYDVALWATIADLPYSWPLWQRYSRKFVVTNLISNVGSFDVNSPDVKKAVESDTLFIHGSPTGGWGSMFKAKANSNTSRALELLGRNMPIDKCAAACGSSVSRKGWMATVCDRSCSPGEHGPRFAGLNCGAGDTMKFGENCRMCYNDLAKAKEAEEQLAQRNALRGMGLTQEHVIMCETLLPPPTSACNSKCTMEVDTVCDESCERGRYNSYNCNWRGYGNNCRFCFYDRQAALKADAVAKARGGRVIMCHTYLPPMEEEVWTEPLSLFDDMARSEERDNAPEEAETEATPRVFDDDSEHEYIEKEPLSPDKEIYVGDIKRGQLCAFMVGRQQFVSETHVAAKSIAHFMPGMRIAIATPPDDVSVYERTLGYLPGVRVTPAIQPSSLSALLADQHCGNDTRLIYYMNPGELLSRTFTSKDTHSVRGDLLVIYADTDRLGVASVTRTLATTSVLGFSSPSFSYGVDIMLPAEINQQLRDVLLSDPEAGFRGKLDENPHIRATRAMGSYKNAFIPEVLAALAYSRNPTGMWFTNPPQWVTRHMFEPASIWDIPLVKPRFGCAFSTSSVYHGYDVARELENQLDHFMHGGACERGFINVDEEALRPKGYIEFGGPTGKAMPTMEGLTVSVVFKVEANVHPILLEASLTSVVEKFPDAAEAVVIFIEPLVFEERVLEVIKAHDKRANFPVFAVNTPVMKEREHRDNWDWSGLHADEYCSGEFLLNMEPGDVLMTTIAYKNIFHFRKPVIPFDRVTKVSRKGPAMVSDSIDECIVKAIQFVLRKPIVHNFTLLRSLAYPREAYENVRMFFEEEYNTDIDTVVNHGLDSCKTVETIASNKRPHVGHRARYEMSLLGAFMWHKMQTAVHWAALNALDVQADEWPMKVEDFNLYCDLRSFDIPDDENAAKSFVGATSDIGSPEACTSFKKLMGVGV